MVQIKGMILKRNTNSDIFQTLILSMLKEKEDRSHKILMKNRRRSSKEGQRLSIALND
jgi:hypothetical protein